MLRTNVVWTTATLAVVGLALPGQGQVPLHPPLPRGDVVTDFAINHRGTLVAIEANVSRRSLLQPNVFADSFSEIHIVPIDGGTSQRVDNATLLPRLSDVLLETFGPDGDTVGFHAQEMKFRSGPVSVASLASSVRDDLTAFFDSPVTIDELRFTPVETGSTPDVVFRAREPENLQGRTAGLHAISLGDTSAEHLTLGMQLVPDSAMRVLAGDATADILFAAHPIGMPEQLRIYRKRLDANGSSPVHPVLASTSDLPPQLASDWIVTPDNQYLIYRGTQLQAGVVELFMASLADASISRLSVPSQFGGDVGPFQMDGANHVVYPQTRLECPGAEHGYQSVYAFDLSTQRSELLYQGDPNAGDGRILRYWITPDGERAIMRERTHGLEQILSVPTSGGEITTLVDGLTALRILHDTVQISPDGERMLFQKSDRHARDLDLLTVPIDGGELLGVSTLLPEGIRLSQHPLLGLVTQEQIIDGQQVLLLTERDVPEVGETTELYSVSLDGGVAIRVSGDDFAASNVREFEVAPETNVVVYRVDHRSQTSNQLHALPLFLDWATTEQANWNEPGNWVLPGNHSSRFLPLSPTTVRIAHPGTRVILPETVGRAEVASLQLGTSDVESTLIVRPSASLAVIRQMQIAGQGKLEFAAGAIHVGQTLENAGEVLLGVGRDERSDNRVSIDASAIRNRDTGSIEIAEGVGVSFFGDVQNDGAISAASESWVSFLSALRGHGVGGTGMVLVGGSLHPAGDAMGRQRFGGELRLTNGSSVVTSSIHVQLGGKPTNWLADQIDVAGDVILAGKLHVTIVGDKERLLANGLGTQFEIVRTDGFINGQFDDVNPPSIGWAIHYLPQKVILELLSPEMRGDYNGDGRIDQADLDLLLIHWGNDRTSAGWTHYLPVASIGQFELDGVLLNWGRSFAMQRATSNTNSASVSEPHTLLALAILAFVAVGRWHWCTRVQGYRPCFPQAVARRGAATR